MKIVMKGTGDMKLVARVLVFFAVVMVVFGVYLMAASSQPMIGVLVLALGLVDGLRALVLSRRA
jgi:hypothetical protein